MVPAPSLYTVGKYSLMFSYQSRLDFQWKKKIRTTILGAILVMDNDGKRLIARYYTDDFPTVREQKVPLSILRYLP